MIVNDGEKDGGLGTGEDEVFLGVDDGLVHGYNNFADVCFIISAVLFLFSFVFRMRLTAAANVSDLAMIGGFIALAIGFLLL